MSKKLFFCILVFTLFSSLITVVQTERIVAASSYEKMRNEKKITEMNEDIEHIHDADCGYVKEIEGLPCNHEHNKDCNYIEPINVIPCDKHCIDTDNDSNINHATDCAYKPFSSGSPCNHQHDKNCGFIDMVERVPCNLEVIKDKNDLEDNLKVITEEKVDGGIKYDYDEDTKTLTISCATVPEDNYERGVMVDYTYADMANGVVPWSEYKNSAENIVFEEGVVSVGIYTFNSFKKVTSIKLSESISVIAHGAFQGCSELAGTIHLNANFIDFSTAIFVDTKINEYTVDVDNITYMARDGILYSKDGKTLINCPPGKTAEFSQEWLKGVTEIALYGFRTCRNITGNLVISENIKTIGRQAFQNCSGFTGDLLVPNTVTDLNMYYTFAGCSSMTGKLTLDSNFTKIAEGAFSTSGFTSMEWKGRVTVIGKNSFRLTTGITNFEIPTSVKIVEGSAFSGNNTNFDFSNSEPLHFDVVGSRAFEYCKLGNITIENGGSVGSNAFDNSEIENLTYHSDTIEVSAFSNAKINNLILGNEVKKIGKQAFVGATLPDVIIVDSHVSTYGERMLQMVKGAKTLFLNGTETKLPDAICYGSSFENVVISTKLEDNRGQLSSNGTRIGNRFTGMKQRHNIYVYDENSRLYIEGVTVDYATVAVLNGGSIPVETVFPKQGLATPVKIGYTFEGWYDNIKLQGNPVTEVLVNKSYYAKWNVIDISFESKTDDNALIYDGSARALNAELSNIADAAFTYTYAKRMPDGNNYFDATTSAPSEIGYYKVIASLDGSDRIVTAYMEIKPAALSISAIKETSKYYDKNNVFENVELVLDGIQGTDKISAKATATVSGFEIGAYNSATLSNIILSGSRKDNYSLSLPHDLVNVENGKYLSIVNPSSPSKPDIEGSLSESGKKVKVEEVRTSKLTKDLLGSKNVILSIKFKETKESVLVNINVGKKLSNKNVYVVQLNPSSNILELVAIANVDKKGNTQFETSSTEELTIASALPIGLITTVETDRTKPMTYFVAENSEFKKGWLKTDSNDYLFFDYATSSLQKDKWVADGTDVHGYANWYSLSIDGKMHKSTWISNDSTGSKWYYVNENGLLLRDTVVDGYVINEDGYWYFE